MSSAVWMRVRAEMRGRWRAWFALAVLLGVPGALLLANAIAALPGRLASRVRPALVLRTE